MAMFAYCKRPVWHRDDLTVCFQADYLQVLLPLLTCAISIIVIALRWSRYIYRQKRESNHDPRLVEVGEDGETDTETESLSELTLQKTISHARHSVIDVDKPRGEVFLVTIELAALLGQLAISVAALVEHTGSSPQYVGRTSAAGILVWTYIASLAGLRLFLSTTKWQLSFAKLWNHTAALYATQWLMGVWIFRSAIIHPQGSLQTTLAIVQFSLTSLLVVIALVSRKGNKGVLLEYEGEIEPSQEPLASVLSLATFSWADAIVWKGYKQTLELADVWNLALKDKAEVVLAQFRQVKKTHGLALRLLLYFKKAVLLQGAWCALASVFMFVPTLVLKAILEYLEDPESTPVNAAWLYVIILFVTGAIQAVADGQGHWIGRKICIQLRAIIVGEIYSKTLRRKATASTESDLGTQKAADQQSFWKKVRSFWHNQKLKMQGKQTALNLVKSLAGTQANNGTIINLVSIDSFKVADICSYLHFLWAATPVQLAMAVGLLYNVLGYSSFVGIGLMVLIFPLNMYIAKSFQAAQKKIMAATDGRIHATNEVLQNIRIIKYFAWEERFQANVNEKRKAELQALWRKYVLWSCAATFWAGIPILITFVSFLIYTIVEKRPLVPSVAFPALSMFSLLRVPLDQLADMVAHVQESKVSVDRVEEFLNEEETERYQLLKLSRQNHLQEMHIGLENATLTWGSKVANESDGTLEGFRLINVDVDFVIGKLNIIAGPTGSGKTSLLMAILGEMKLLAGDVHIPGGFARQDLHPDPQTGLTESVAYCAQQAWLVNATIKENILFASPFDSQRYRAVLSACALERDLEILDAGDQTLVGEKGITLSGGQKQRVSLARAIYSNSKHLLLDDCLSAVDSHTAKHIFELALMGNLMTTRTCILVSHNVSLTVPESSFVVVLDNGKIAAKGSPLQVMESGALGDDFLKSRVGSTLNSTAPSRVPSSLDEETSKITDQNASGNDSPDTRLDARKGSTNGRKFVDTRLESKATGSVKAATIIMYLRAMGPWYYWIVAASAFIAAQLGSVATNLWIRQWANSYHRSSSQLRHASVHAFSQFTTYSTLGLTGLGSKWTPQSSPTSHKHFFASSPHHVDAGYYLGVYALIGIVYIVICLSQTLVLFWGSRHASWKLHERLLQSILRAKFKFFDSTPLGQLTNRFSKDIQTIDQEVTPVAIGVIHSAASVLIIVILISVITPGFLVPGFFITLMYIATGLFYIRSSRDLKRIEAVQRSPLFQHFGETLSGVVTIRAYGDEARFIQDSNQRVNTHNRPFIYLWATNRWLAFRIDFAGALVASFSAIFVVLNAGKIDAGAAGLALSYAITFTQNVLWLVRLYAANEQNMNAVERVQEYIDVEQEAPAKIPKNKPAANWPSRGAVEFIGYGTRYRSDLEPVLKNVSFKVEAGQKVGIVGRTGAGKTSLTLALFRGLEAEAGKILIDDVDIGLIGLQDLREGITIVPQDPTLFTGTLRNNLDPFNRFTDEEVFTALRRVQLISKAHDDLNRSGAGTPDVSSKAPTVVVDSSPSQNGDATHSENGTVASGATLAKFKSNSKENKNIFHNLSSPIAESGSNLSQGQRQLLCLARALLKSPKVLVMDEATASIDYATDANIQNTLRELKDNTIITIAHRLQTIIDYDKVLVLDRGEVVEFADPWELIQKENGSFRSMCETSGDFEMLQELAQKAWQDRRLIDDS